MYLVTCNSIEVKLLITKAIVLNSVGTYPHKDFSRRYMYLYWLSKNLGYCLKHDVATINQTKNILNQMLSDFYCISLYKNTPNLPLLIPSGFSRGFQDTYGHLGRAIPV